ncbi:MAG: hypothetical protein MI892_23130 [Desulfobacterales bacterium]|nr:hypothetical protein [Desulfobacterales bacterium]
MEPINEKNNETINTVSFPLDIIEQSQSLAPPSDTEASSDYTVESYDNREQLSELSSLLGSRLDGFAQTLATTYFFSEAFSWLTMTAKTEPSGTVLATAYEDAQEDIWLLGVDELAGAGTQKSVTLNSESRSSFDSGSYEFSLTVNDSTYDIEFSFENEDTDPLTNHQFFIKLERALVSTGADISTQVTQIYEKVYSEEYVDNYGLEQFSFLSLANGESGQDQSLTLEDTTGELIALLGLDKNLAFPKNSEYTIDSEAFEFYSNTIEIDGDAVQAVLTGETDDGGEQFLVQIKTTYGFTALAESVKTVIEEYNSLIEWIDENQYFISTSLKATLFSDLNSAVLETQAVSYKNGNGESDPDAVFTVGGENRIYDDGSQGFLPRLDKDTDDTIESDLAGIGLTLNTDGTLGVEDRFETNFRSRFSDIYEILSGDNGFFTKISNALDSIRNSDSDQYVYSKNHILVYSTDAASEAKKIYQENVSSLINIFA